MSLLRYILQFFMDLRDYCWPTPSVNKKLLLFSNLPLIGKFKAAVLWKHFAYLGMILTDLYWFCDVFSSRSPQGTIQTGAMDLGNFLFYCLPETETIHFVDKLILNISNAF